MDGSQCIFCWRLLNVPEYAKLFIEPPPATILPAPIHPPCIHKGKATGTRTQCASCGPSISLKVFECALHGQCVPDRRGDGVRSCLDCGDWKRGPDPFPAPGPLRHLLYHVWPRKGSLWRRNLEEIKQRISLFNGRRIIGIVTDNQCEHEETVREVIEDAEYIVMPNDPRRREVQTFEPLWSKLETLNGRDCIFYAHSKGAQYPDGGTWRWADVMYKANLDYWPLVEQALQSHPMVGPFKKNGGFFNPSASSWHYSGTFFWVRAKYLYSRNWRNIDQHWWGMESWPGLQFLASECACLFHERTGHMDLYNGDYWRDSVTPEWEAWQVANAGSKT